MGTQCIMLLMRTASGITSQPLHQSPLVTIQNSRVEKDLLLGNWTLVTFSPKGWGSVFTSLPHLGAIERWR